MAGPIYVSNAGQLGDVGETVVCAGAACHGYLSFRGRDSEAAYFIWHLFGMPLHLRLRTREHYRTLLDAHLLREVRRWFALGPTHFERCPASTGSRCGGIATSGERLCCGLIRHVGEGLPSLRRLYVD